MPDQPDRSLQAVRPLTTVSPLSLSGLFLCLFTIAASIPVTAVPPPVATIEGITQYDLSNGLRVLLCPDPSRPTITANMTYLVGSRHEGRGESGMAHMLEHLLGNATAGFPSLREALEARGADFNATTWFDRTNFFETLTASDDNLEFVLQLEAERMTSAQLTDEALAKEMQIISNEVEMDENDPLNILSQRMLSTAYLWHSYGNTPIGNLSDIRRFPLASLRRFYDSYYQPDNAVLLLAGRFDPATALALVERHFAAIPRPQRQLAATHTEEPPQDGPRLVTLSRGGAGAAVGLLYHTAAGADPDVPALDILYDILTAEPWGRLHEALVDSGLASSISGDTDAMGLAEPGVMEIIAKVPDTRDPRQVLEQMAQLVEGTAAAGISERAVERAKARRLKKLRRLMTDTSKFAVELSEWIALGDWRIFFIHRDRLAQVTVAEVEAVARNYLLPSNRTAGIFAPTTAPTRTVIRPRLEIETLVADYKGTAVIDAGEAFVATPAAIKGRTIHFDLAPGIKLALLPKKTRGQTVRAEFRFHYGDAAGLHGQRAAMRLLAGMMMRGTQERNHIELRDAIDMLQSEIELWSYSARLGGSIESDRAHLIPAIQLLAEILRRPAFDEEQFELVKRERLAKLEGNLSSPVERCFNTVRRGLYPWPAESIHYRPTLEEEIAEFESVTVEMVRELYDRFLGASQAEISIIGDFELGQAMKTLGEAFGDWESASPYVRIAEPYRPIRAEAQTILTPDKQMAIVGMATMLELRDDDPAYPALEMANYILGGTTQGRLPQRLRYRDGLSYHAASTMQVGDEDRSTNLFGYAFCSPANAPVAMAAMREEVEAWIATGVSAEELAAAKISYARETELELADDEYVAGELARGLRLDRCFSFHADLLTGIEALSAAEVNRTLNELLASTRFLEVSAGDLASVEP